MRPPFLAGSGLGLALAVAAGHAPALAGGSGPPAEPAPVVAQTLMRRTDTPDVAPPERRFALERPERRLTDYEIRLRFAAAPAAPLSGQTVTCRARLSNDRLFEFAYRDQTIPAGRVESDSYVFSVPDNTISIVRCLLGPWPGT